MIKHCLLIGDSNLSWIYSDPKTEAASYLMSNALRGVVVHNLAIPGQQMRLAAHYYSHIIKNFAQDIIIMLGTNDWTGARAYNDAAGDYYHHLIRLIDLAPSKKWYIVCPPPTRDGDKDLGGGLLATYRCMCKMAAEVTGQVAIDSWKAGLQHNDYSDWLHLTDSGRVKLLDAVSRGLCIENPKIYADSAFIA